MSTHARITAMAASVALTASLGLAGPAVAGSHWRQAKCNAAITKFDRAHQPKTPTAKSDAKFAKQQAAYIKKLQHQHGCVFRG